MEGNSMNPADEIPATIEAPESTSAPTDFGHKLDEPAPVGGFEPASEQRRPVEDLHSLLLRISHHLDYETSERSTIYYRLLALDAQAKKIEKQTKGRFWRTLFRYAVVICLAVAGTLAWQTYGEAAKQIIATRGPDLGWSPEAKQTIANWVQQLGWTKSSAGPETAAVRASATTPQTIAVVQTAPEASESKAPAIPPIDPEQVQQITRSLTALQQSVEQLAATQDQMARQITSLQAADSEILSRVPTPAPLPPAPPARKLAPPARPPVLAR
jgi:hypothetical protein